MFLCIALGLGPLADAANGADLSQRLQVFGHLTQAYGESSLGSIQGTTEVGTTDLRKIALQFRWQASESGVVVIQLAHERVGDDIFSPEGEEVEIDWAFYEWRIGSNSALKIGRLNVPLGIYNQVRDVGTLLPYFNLPISFYAGVLSSAETVDGISIAHTFAARTDWALDAEFYAGGWDTFQQQVRPETRFGLVNLEARAEDGVGVQLWLNTPVPGLRLGAGALTWLLDGPLSLPGTKDRWNSYHASFDLTAERWVLRAEARRWRFDLDFGAFVDLGFSLPGDAGRDGYYVQLGRWLTPKLGLFGQLDDVGLRDDLAFFPALKDFHRDMAVSLNYRFRPDLLAKIELHRADTRFPLGSPEVPANVGADAVRVDWLVVGLSASF